MMEKRNWLYLGLRGFLGLFLFKALFPLKIHGKENLPDKGPAILCANHISLLDPILLGCISRAHVTFMAKRELFTIPIIGKIIAKLGTFPVNRGQVDRKAIKNSLAELKAGQVFGIFPEGTRKTENKKPLKGVGFLAARSKAPVVPVSISGPYKPFRSLQVTVYPPLTYQAEQFNHHEDPLLAFSQYIIKVVNQEIDPDPKLINKQTNAS